MDGHMSNGTMVLGATVNGSAGNGDSLPDRMALYRRVDQQRQDEFEHLAQAVTHLQELLQNAQADLEDEQSTRRAYRRRAEEAETAAQRNQFALVLVDGDGYIFKESFLKDASVSGGADAAHQLDTEIQNYLRANNLIPNTTEIDVVVNVYANKSGLSRTLYEAGMLDHPTALDAFFQSFSRTKSLFQFIDCGPGKERADAKLRDTYRFYAYNTHCRHIFLACCHDNGYVAELDKYRHDSIAAPKTIFIHAAQPAREYASLPFPVARFSTVFETSAIVTRQHIYPKPPRASTQQLVAAHTEWPTPIGAELTPVESRTSSYSAVISPPATIAALPVRTSTALTRETPPKTPTPVEKVVEKAPVQPTGDPKGVPINRAGQRIDRRMRQPSTTEQERFEARIRYRKLCNEHHLRNSCYTYSCKFDHDPIDAEMKNTLRYVARRIPCSAGMKCRRGDCYYGHQCPWGNDSCNNPKCGFIKGGLHEITDLEVAKFVPAAS